MSRIRSVFDFLNRSEGSVADKTVRSGAWVSLSNAFSNSLKFVTSIILARLLEPEHFGLMGIALFFFKAINVVSQPGLAAAIIHRRDEPKGAMDAAWSVFILRGLLLGGVTFAAAPLISDFYDEASLTEIIRVIACSFVIHGFANSYLITLRKEMDFKRLTIGEVVVATVHLVVVVTLAYVYRSVWALVIGQIVMTISRVIMSFVVTPERPRFSLPGPLIKELFKYGKFVTATAVLTFFASNIDNALVGKILGVVSLGYYVLAYRLATLPVTHIAPILTRVLFPAFSKLQSEKSTLRRLYLQVLKLAATISVPMAAGIAVLGPEVVSVLYGTKWLPMVGALYVLCILAGFRSLAVTTQPVFLALGMPQVNFYLYLFKFASILALIYPLTMRHGITGTAWAVTVPACAEQLVLWAILGQALDCPLRLILKSILAPVLAAATMASSVYLLKVNLAGLPGAVSLLSCVAFGGAVYVVLVAFLDRELIDDCRRRLKAVLTPTH